MSTQLSRKIGFTLIELLVVIAIIAILAAILFPVFAKAREKARQTTCESNEKQIALAVIQYVQDYDEFFPNYTGTSGVGSWKSQVYSYVKSSGVFVCPSNASSTTPANQTTESFGHCPVHYDLNPAVDGYTLISGVGWFGAPSSKLVVPTTTILIGETVGDGNGYGIRIDMPIVTVGTHHWLFGGHTGMGNFAFCDGHVKAMKWGQTVDPSVQWVPSGNVNSPPPGQFNTTTVATYQAVGAAQDAYWANENE